MKRSISVLSLVALLFFLDPLFAETLPYFNPAGRTISSLRRARLQKNADPLLLSSSRSTIKVTGIARNREKIETLVIESEVTIMLVEDANARLEVVGHLSLHKYLQFEQKEGTLRIYSSKNRDLREEGIVYVPASKLRTIRLNGNAHVWSFCTLHLPQIDVILNASAKVAISNTGIVNLIESNDYAVEETSPIYRSPVKLDRMKINEK